MIPIQLFLLSGGADTVVAPQGQASDWFGYAVASGDVDGDGHSDLVVGAYGDDTLDAEAGAAWVIWGDDLTTGTRLLAEGASGDRFGQAVASGDVDGDGRHDVLVGAPTDDDLGTNSGTAWLFLGEASGVSETGQILLAASGAEEDAFGIAVALTDLDGDGFDDAVVGAYGDDELGDWSGSIEVALGSASGLGPTVTTTAPDGATGDYLGLAVSAAGDLDADGYQDVIAGAYGDDDGGAQSGSATVWFGSPAGLERPQKLVASDGAEYDWFGVAVTGAGDLDADGFEDVAVGAYGADPSGSASGAAYVFYGTSTGLDLASEQLVVPDDGDTNDAFGAALAGAGDLDGDGFSDLLIGAYRAAAPAEESGAAYVFYGSGAGLDPSSQHTLAPTVQAGDALGFAVAAAGDVDGDGFDDVALGAYQSDQLGSASGSVVVSYGGCRIRRWYQDGDQDGWGVGQAAFSCEGPDGWASRDGDCDDTNPDAHPDAVDWPLDGADQDCDGHDACWLDADGDGFGTTSSIASDDDDCDDDGESTSSDDCDDEDAGTFPGAAENESATACMTDADLDGYGAESPISGVTAGTDCDDLDAEVWPGAPEVPDDGRDQDCDGFDAESEADDSTDSPVDSTPSEPAPAPESACGCDRAPGAWLLAFAGALLVRRRVT